jgi:hypothetical protein
MPLIWVNREAEYFFRHDWTGQISLNRLAKFDFTRTGFGPEKRTAQPHDEPSYPAHAGVSSTPRLLESIADGSEYWITRFRG